MQRRAYAGEWQRKKEYLIRPLFTETGLSPILEHREPTPSPAERTVREYSPLPDLIIEKQRRYEYEDETEEFYNKLEIKMKRFYRKIFLGEDIDVEVSDQSMHDYSNEEGVDDFGDEGVVRDDPGGDDDSTVHLVSEEEVEAEEKSVMDSEASYTTIMSSETAAQENLEKKLGKIYSFSSSDENVNKNEKNIQVLQSQTYTEISITDSEASHTTSSESAAQENLVKKLGKIYGVSSSDETGSKDEDNTQNRPSQTYTEKPDKPEDNHSARSKTESESSGAHVETIVERALIHTGEKDIRELEVIRRRTMFSLEDSFVQPSNSSKDERLELNITHSMEDLSTINTSVPMEIDSIVQPTRISSPLKEISPVIAWKRPASNVPHDIAAKKKKIEKETAERSHEIETEEKNQRDVATETEVSSDDKDVQVNIPRPLTVGNTETQTNILETRDASTHMLITQADVRVQTDPDPLWVECRNAATQTEERETRDESTQTRRSFEYLRFFDEVNIFFFF